MICSSRWGKRSVTRTTEERASDGRGAQGGLLTSSLCAATLPAMSNEETPEPSPSWAEWYRQYQKERDEQAAHWLGLGHQLDEEGWHDEESCRPCLETKTVVNDC